MIVLGFQILEHKHSRFTNKENSNQRLTYRQIKGNGQNTQSDDKEEVKLLQGIAGIVDVAVLKDSECSHQALND